MASYLFFIANCCYLVYYLLLLEEKNPGDTGFHVLGQENQDGFDHFARKQECFHEARNKAKGQLTCFKESPTVKRASGTTHVIVNAVRTS